MDLQKQKESRVEKVLVGVERKPLRQEERVLSEQEREAADIEMKKQVAEEIEAQTPTDDAITPSGPVVSQKSPYIAAIEGVLEENLENLYSNLPENKREAFKKEGEIVASKIEKIIQSAKVSVKKIIDLIRRWLLMVPGVNKMFLEQEAKIKADKILTIREDREKRN